MESEQAYALEAPEDGLWGRLWREYQVLSAVTGQQRRAESARLRPRQDHKVGMQLTYWRYGGRTSCHISEVCAAGSGVQHAALGRWSASLGFETVDDLM